MDIWYKIIAIIGACAWIPPIVQIIIKLATKPKLTIFPHRSFQLGYTTNGPIINIGVALSAENSECLITNVDLDVKGPNNEQHQLKWQWLEEKLYEIDYSELGLTPVRKQQNAIAIKVLKENLVEKTIGFHEHAFIVTNDISYKATTRKYELLIRNNQDIQGLRATQEYDTFRTLLSNSLIWKEGTYEANIKVSVLNISQPFNKKFKFIVSANDIQQLQSNIDVCLTLLERHYFPLEDEYIAKWNWVNPSVLNPD